MAWNNHWYRNLCVMPHLYNLLFREKTMNDKDMIRTLKDRLALQRDVIARLHHGREQQVKKNAELAKENADLAKAKAALVLEIRWMKGEGE